LCFLIVRTAFPKFWCGFLSVDFIIWEIYVPNSVATAIKEVEYYHFYTFCSVIAVGSFRKTSYCFPSLLTPQDYLLIQAFFRNCWVWLWLRITTGTEILHRTINLRPNPKSYPFEPRMTKFALFVSIISVFSDS
jgi:hypothetical protein